MLWIVAVAGLGCAADNPAFAPGAAGTGSGSSPVDGTTSKGPPGGSGDGVGTSSNPGQPTMPMTGAGDAGDDDGLPADDTGPWDTGDDDEGEGDDDGNVVGACPPEIPCTLEEGGIDRVCGDGNKCQPFADDFEPGFDVAYCAPVENDRTLRGDPCTWDCSGDSCDPASVCIPNAVGARDGVCHGLCDPTLDWVCENPNTRCAARGNYHACMPICDPLLQNCPGDLQCYFDNGFVCLPPEGDVELGQECDDHQDCGPQAACLPSEDVNCGLGAGALCCALLCSASGVDCPQMQNCIPLGLPAPWEDVGSCEF
ncbi:MAG: hypothetical protein AAF721_34935 [Myxococcota bacterium]